MPMNSVGTEGTKQKRICVIGAGGSGLPCVRWAREYGADVTCFERSNGVGGLWHYKPNPTDLSNVMRGTVINTSKEILAYSDFPPDENLPNFMHHSLLHRYLEDYCTHHDLWRNIKLQHKVTSVERTADYSDTGRWNVTFVDLTTGKEGKQIFDGVMVASGHQDTPYYPPPFPGQETFTGRISHSHDYRSTAGYEEKTVIVVGIGNSGADVASELARVTKKVYLVCRRGGAWIFNRMVERGVPYDYVLANRFTNNVLLKVISPTRFSKMLVKDLNKRFDHEQFRIKPKNGPLSSHPTVCDELPLRLMAGTVIVRPQIKKFSLSSVVFEDGTEAVNVDEVVFCTGFKYNLNIIENGRTLPVENNRHPGMYLHMFPPQTGDKNTLCFIGLLMPWGGLFPVAEMQARLFCAQMFREISLPNVDQMRLSISKDEEKARQRYTHSNRHYFEVDFVPYLERLAGILRCRPSNFRLMFTDWTLFKKVFFGPCVSPVYRLHGKHSWIGAREAILGVEHRTSTAYLGLGPVGSHSGYCQMGRLEKNGQNETQRSGTAPNGTIHINNFDGPCVLLNFYGLLVIYVATPPQMESFQRYILTVQYLGILNDLILSYGVFVIFSFPAWGLIPIGLFVAFGIPTQIELIVWFGCVTTFIAALLVALFQRQQAITPVDHWAKLSKRTVQVIELAVYLHPFYSVVPIIYYLFTLNDLNVAIQYNYQSWPQLQQFYQSPSYWTMQGNIAEIFGHAIVGRYVNVILLVLIVLYIVIYWTLYKLRHIFSERTLMLQKKWIRNLNTQTVTYFFGTGFEPNEIASKSIKTPPNPDLALKKKEKQIEEKLFGVRVIDKICDQEKKCFEIKDVGSLDERGNFFVARKIIPTNLQDTAVTLAQLQKPKELTWQNFNTKTWPVQNDRLFSVYNQVQVGSILLGQTSTLPNPDSLRVLLIGLGGGAVFNFLSNVEKVKIQTTAIEINPTFVEISKKWFNLAENAQSQILVEDGLIYVKNAVEKNAKFDSILLDACYDDQKRPIICPVNGFLAKKSIENLYQLLDEEGTLTVNLYTGQDQAVNEEKVFDEFAAVFKSCILLNYDPRRMLICFKDQKLSLSTDRQEILDRFKRADAVFDFSLLERLSELNK
ncbi:unnamed protein product, partial [Mesorhabditis belari]|uniref:Flavin-containing monooxygenase n=1 Tax=Mesorhabditis belari TaxID=2138241 RepID=A0AAF3ENS3_9BILA